jgi:ferredoxin
VSPVPEVPEVTEVPEVPVAETPVPEVDVAPAATVATAAAVASPQIPGEVFEGVGSGKYKVVVLKDKCIGAASCVAVSPKTFELNDQQIAKVLPTVNTETDENLLLAAQSCPTLAIEVYDTATGEKVWPK